MLLDMLPEVVLKEYPSDIMMKEYPSAYKDSDIELSLP